MANQTIFRVLRLTKEQKDSLRQSRERRGENNQTVITNAVKDNLPRIMTALFGLGFCKARKKSPARLPFAQETLSDLNAAASAVGVPASTLFLLCLSGATESKGKATGRIGSRRTPLDEIKGLAPKTKKGGEIIMRQKSAATAFNQADDENATRMMNKAMKKIQKTKAKAIIIDWIDADALDARDIDVDDIAHFARCAQGKNYHIRCIDVQGLDVVVCWEGNEKATDEELAACFPKE